MSRISTLLAILFHGACLGIAPLDAQALPSIYQPTNSPQPLAPLPTPSQFRWHQQELQIFIHFGVNTFTGKGWGDGTENPDLFHPHDSQCQASRRFLPLAISAFSLHFTSFIIKEAEEKKTGTREEKSNLTYPS